MRRRRLRLVRARDPGEERELETVERFVFFGLEIWRRPLRLRVHRPRDDGEP